MTGEMLPERESLKPIRLIRIGEVKARVGLSTSTIHRWVTAGRFPKPIKLGGHLIAWPEDVIDQWVKSKLASD